MKKIILVVGLVVLIVGVAVVWKFQKTEAPALVSSFEECAAAGNPIMESYPRQCRNGEQSFTENIGNELEKADLIRLESPRPNQEVSSPLEISGEARGVWFFEASFPVFLVDWDGRIIAQGIATADGEWMTENFVPFKAKLEFVLEKDVYSNRGALILKKDNPSGLPEHDDALEIPLTFRLDGERDVAAQLRECLPKSDMASKEKCDGLLAEIRNFEECVAAGFSIMKSNPLQCQLPDERILVQQTNSTWEMAVAAVNDCEVEKAFQTHSNIVTLELKNGNKLVAAEPKIDDIFKVVSGAEAKCGQMILGTE